MTVRQSLVELAADACDRAIRAGAGDADAYLRWGPVARVTLQHGATKQAGGCATNLALRVWRDGRAALATTNDLSPTGVAEAVAKAVADTPAGPRAEPLLADAAPGTIPAAEPVNLDFGCAAHVDALETMFARMPERLSMRSPILSAAYSATQLWTVLVNTAGFRGAHRSERHALWLWMESDAGQTILGGAGRRFADLATERIGDVLAVRAAPSARGADLPAMSCPVLLPPAATADLARALGGLLTGDQVVASEALRRRLGRAIASPALTLIDDATLPDGLLSRPFDDEGTAATRTALLESGVFASALHTRESAARLGADPNGKAVRPELWKVPTSARSNLFFAPGGDAPAALERGLDRGLAVSSVQRPGRMNGGAFALVADGWWVERGERVRRVAGARLSLNVFELLRSIAACGDDLEFSPLGHGAGGPSLLVEQMEVA